MLCTINHHLSSGIAITSGYAIKQCGRLIKTVDGKERDQISKLQTRLESKIRIISPAIDMIELIAARGNTSLDSAVALTKSIRYEIQALGMKLAAAVDGGGVSTKSAASAHSALVLSGIISDIKALLSQIEDAVPLINLAITTSGVNLSTALPATVSPSRLLQASTFLSAGDSAYAMNSSLPTQIGPVFMLSLYMLFEGHANRARYQEGIRDTTWQEVVHKARVKLLRVPLSRVSDLPGVEGDQLRTSTQGHDNAESGDFFPKYVPSDGKAHEFAYQLLIIEDLDDDRFHNEDEQSGPFDDVLKAGIREVIPIHQVSKIFYADTGKILNIGADGEPNNPVLLLKRDVNAVPPRRMVDRDILTDDDDELPQNGAADDHEGDESVAQLHRESSMSSSTIKEKKDKWRFPAGLDPEWLAFEVFTEQPDYDNDDYDEDAAEADEAPTTPDRSTRAASLDPVAAAFSRMHLRSLTPGTPNTPKTGHNSIASPPRVEVPLNVSTVSSSIPALRSSLSLLELLVRLTALQQFQQSSHLAISDELLNFFLSESSSTGAGTDGERRKMMRASARQKVGFDPYAESPIRLRNEEYLHQREQDPRWNGEYYDDEYEYQHPVRSTSSRYSTQPESSPFRGSPSPSIRASKSWGSRSLGFGESLTPLGVVRSRTEVLRQEGRRKSSPLTRSESDSTLGTSPPAAPGASK